MFKYTLRQQCHLSYAYFKREQLKQITQFYKQRKKTAARFREKFTVKYVRNLPLNPSLTGIVDRDDDDDDLQAPGLRAVLRNMPRLRGLNCGLK